MNSEDIAYKYFVEKYDNNAKLYGGMDSTVSDIYSFKYGWIEVKDLTHGARAGQFTDSTINENPYSKKLLKDNKEENCKNFVRYHYTQKKLIFS